MAKEGVPMGGCLLAEGGDDGGYRRLAEGIGSTK